MPRTIDRRQTPEADKNPNRFGTDYTDPQGAINEGATKSGDFIRNALAQAIKDTTGIDITGVYVFMDWLSEQVGVAMSNFGEMWQGLLDGIVNIWNEATTAIGSVVEDAVLSIQKIFHLGQNAALSADNANIGVQSIKAQLAGGGFDEFDYPSSNDLPSGTYNKLASGPGGGSYGPNGDGFLVWKPSGAQAREIIYRRSDVTLGSDNGVITVVWSAKPYDPAFSDAYGYICGRFGASTWEHIRAVIDNNSARIQVYASGTLTQIGSSVTLTIKNGDVFEFWYGTAAHPRRFILKQNGTTVIDVADGDPDGTGAVSQIGTDYRKVGLGAYADNYLVFFQNPPPALAGWTWAVQTS
jgi:hypothetical protein